MSRVAQVLVEGEEIAQLVGRVNLLTGGSLMDDLLALPVGGGAIIALVGDPFNHAEDLAAWRDLDLLGAFRR